MHLDGFDQTDLMTGKSAKSSRDFVFYYDETTLSAIWYRQFKLTFSAKLDGHWDDPLENLGRPQITNLLMDPYERQWGNVNRQLAERKTWILTPMVGIVDRHLATFRDFPVRQIGLSANFGKTLDHIQNQLLQMQHGK